MMSCNRSKSNVIVLFCLISLFAGSPTPSLAEIDDLVMIFGESSSEEGMFIWTDGPMGRTGRQITREEICNALQEKAYDVLQRSAPGRADMRAQTDRPITAIAEVMVSLREDQIEFDANADHGRPFTAEEQQEMERNRSIFRDIRDLENDCEAFDGSYMVLYSSCAMMMRQGPYLMYWSVTPDGSSSLMEITNPQEEKVYSMDWATGLKQIPQAGRGVTNPTEPRVSEGTGSKEFSLHVEIGTPGESVGFQQIITAPRYEHAYAGKLMLPLGGNMGMNFANMRSKGHAYITDQLPGIEVIQAYYAALDRTFTQSSGANTLFSAMSMQLAKLSMQGFPLEFQQTIVVNMLGLGALGGMMGAGHGSDSNTTVKAVSVWPGGAAETGLCGHTAQAPEGYELVDMSQMLAEAGGTGADGSPITLREAWRENFRSMFRGNRDKKKD